MFLLVARHEFDDIPVSLHPSRIDAEDAAKRYESGKMPPGWASSEPTYGADSLSIVEFVHGEPVSCSTVRELV